MLLFQILRIGERLKGYLRNVCESVLLQFLFSSQHIFLYLRPHQVHLENLS